MSYSQDIKNELLNLDPKMKNCCCFSYLYGFQFNAIEKDEYLCVYSTNVKNQETFEFIASKAFPRKRDAFKIDKKYMYLQKSEIRYFTIAEIQKNIFKCPKCQENFLKGLFIACGTASNPEVSYRIDLNIGNEAKSFELASFLQGLGLDAKTSKRNGKHFVYLKKSDDVGDFLALCGSNSATFDILNCKIEKEIRNKANRQTNCDSGNISKSILASQKYLVVINKLIERGLIESLPENLKEIAILRLENPSLSFTELGKLLNPVISKSGVFHRLEKIVSFYEGLKL